MRFDGVWFRYGRRLPWALREIDATVEPGQTVVVLGRNGAGKSTLLQLAAGVLRPVRGSVRDRPPIVGWVPERFPADQPFTAEQYLRRMARLRGVAESAAGEWMERLLLAEHAGTRLGDLSKGTAQKVGVAQALLARPGLLVLDEPWEGLDAAARTLIPEIVAEVTATGGIVLVSDHRNEIAGLPGATHWQVTESSVRFEEPTTPADEVIIEVAVRRADADQAVVRLRAEGHRVLDVRDLAPPQPHHGPSGPDASSATPQSRADLPTKGGSL
ncbi:ATP-binding cassette domain-containing protein [Paractinoplanes atraurantiacus]|uniref:ABC transporter n=1 Tax=Paractinoplanes atraurantiacus TaxID=1036182 RepID=A0A285IYM3_9ACTN|nr:ABC transporter ATP-binding protein [Actinoplanes atraurantiacus]SNY52001.1 ABC transporter [Actinoplanes atraurantiacus]